MNMTTPGWYLPSFRPASSKDAESEIFLGSNVRAAGQVESDTKPNRHLPGEKMNMLLEFGRKLVATNSLDLILSSTVRAATDLVPGSFCKVLMLDETGNFLCRANYPAKHGSQTTPRDEKQEPPTAQA
ncbi:hypothetical protein FDZ73_21110, partial [bacterium]